jgi:tetratricopeptide (TPR) repeat protein
MMMHVKPPMKLFVHFFILLLVAGIFETQAQSTAINNDPYSKFKQAQEYFLNDQYSLAIPVLLELKQSIQSTTIVNNAIQVEEVDFYILACRLQQNDERVLSPSIDYIRYAFNQPRTQQLSFHLANFYFRKQQFNDALEYYEKAEIGSLNNEQVAEAKFRMAYSYFHLKRFSQAKPLFNTIRQLPMDPHYLDFLLMPIKSIMKH